MAEENKTEAPAKSGNAIVIVLVVVILVLVGGGVAGFLLMRGSGGAAKPKESTSLDDRMGPLVNMKSFVVNLAEPGGTRYLKLSLELELRRALNEEEAKLAVRVHDKLLVYLGSLRTADVQRREAKLKLKEKLRDLANEAYGGRVVKAVYFREFVIQ